MLFDRRAGQWQGNLRVFFAQKNEKRKKFYRTPPGYPRGCKQKKFKSFCFPVSSRSLFFCGSWNCSIELLNPPNTHTNEPAHETASFACCVYVCVCVCTFCNCHTQRVWVATFSAQVVVHYVRRTLSQHKPHSRRMVERRRSSSTCLLCVCVCVFFVQPKKMQKVVNLSLFTMGVITKSIYLFCGACFAGGFFIIHVPVIKKTKKSSKIWCPSP